MDILIFEVFFFLILIPLVLGMIIPIYKKHHETTNGIINYDPYMRKFIYKVNLSKEQIIGILNTKNATDELVCKVCYEESSIEFSEYGSSKKYYYSIQEYRGFSILRLEQAAWIGTKSYIPYKLNPFMVKKLQAELIPFSQQ